MAKKTRRRAANYDDIQIRLIVRLGDEETRALDQKRIDGSNICPLWPLEYIPGINN